MNRQSIVKNQSIFVLKTFHELLSCGFELRRILITAIAMNNLGFEIKKKDRKILLEKMKLLQNDDGGFVDTKETLYALEVFCILNYQEGIYATQNWILSMIAENGGVKLHARDKARMPLTAFVYEVFKRLQIDTTEYSNMEEFIVKTWMKELEYNGLTYKAGRFLSAYAMFDDQVKGKYDEYQLLSKTTEFIYNNIQEDGGFSPNKELELSSSPYITSIVIRGLLLTKQNNCITERVLEYLSRESKQNQGWAEHEKDYVTASVINNLSIIDNKVKEI